MTKLDIVIGREENLHRLLVKMGQKAFVVGSPQSVPNSVSRNHCALVVEFSDDSTRKVLGIVIRNLNLQNSTYVDEQEIETKKIKESSRMICENFGGEVPQTLKELTTLPGVGRKTADVVLSNAFNHDAIAVDTHVFRVTNRIGIVNEKNVEKTEFALMDVIPKNRWSHSHHLFIFHGRRMCKARKPECDACPIKDDCDYYNNLQK